MTEKGKFLFYAAWLPLYSRLHRENLAETGPRFKLLEMIGNRPGIHLQQIVTDSGFSRGACTYHLQVLDREGYIQSRRDGRLKKFYRTGSGDLTTDQFEKNISPTASRILHHITENPGVGQHQIATELDISRELTRHHLSRIGHLVTSTRMGRELRYSIGNEGAPRVPLRSRICQVLEERPGIAPSELAEMLGVTRPAISYQVRILEEAGAVERVKEGKGVRLFLTPRVQN